MKRAKLLAALAPLSLFVLACGGSPVSDSGRPRIPEPLRERSAREEVRPFTGFAVVGISLYRVSGSVPDNDWAYVVGVDAQDHLYEGEALMRRLGTLTDEAFADRAIAILLREAGQHPVMPDDARPHQVSEEEWRTVTAPRRVENAVVFSMMEGEMDPTLSEIAIDTTTFAVTRRSAVDVLRASGRTVTVSGPICQVFSRCGCYDGCKRFTTVRVPDTDDLRFRVEGEPESQLYTTGAPCTGDACARVCRADRLDASCEPALVAIGEPCTEACPPGEAPFHCETVEDGCREVRHTVRVVAPAASRPTE